MSKSQQALSKGPKMEELLRSYFLKAGYYVVRGVPFVYEGFDVTDIDCVRFFNPPILSPRQICILASPFLSLIITLVVAKIVS